MISLNSDDKDEEFVKPQQAKNVSLENGMICRGQCTMYTREQVFPCRAARTICNVHFNQQTQLSCNLCQELQRTVCHYYAHKKLDIGFFSAAVSFD